MRKDALTSNPVLFSGVAFLFFTWGAVTILNDLLVPVLKQAFHLNYFFALLVQFAFFVTYFVMSLPMVVLVNRWRYQKSMMAGLGVIALGCLLFIPAQHFDYYVLFLVGLFVLATGVVILQVSANTFMTLLGSPHTASSRLTLSQGINSFGYVITPLIVGAFISMRALPYIYVALAVFSLLVMFFIGRLSFSDSDQVETAHAAPKLDMGALISERYFLLAILAIFFYVGTEVSEGSIIVNFLGLKQIAAMPIETASRYLAVFWGGAMVGRFIGSYLLVKVQQTLVLLAYALLNTALIFMAVWSAGHVAMWCVLSLGLFNSIMFPSIFAMGVALFQGESHKNAAGGWLVMAIVGGACVPVLLGYLADKVGLHHALLLLALSYIYIAVFACLMYRQSDRYGF